MRDAYDHIRKYHAVLDGRSQEILRAHVQSDLDFAIECLGYDIDTHADIAECRELLALLVTTPNTPTRGE
jgi:hypothetical protein